MDYPNSIVSFTLMLIVWKNYSLVQLSLTLNLASNSIQENLISKHCILFWGHPVHRTLSVSVTHDYRSNVPYVLYSCGQKYIIFFARYLLTRNVNFKMTVKDSHLNEFTNMTCNVLLATTAVHCMRKIVKDPTIFML